MASGTVIESINNMDNVEELLKIMLVGNMLQEHQQINILLEQIKVMEENQSAVLQELADLKKQLNDMQEGKKSKLLANFMGKTKEVAKAQRTHLQGIKKDLNEKAKQVVQHFKNAGIKALYNVCNLLGVQDKLIALRDQARSSEMHMKNAVEKIAIIETELTSASVHFKNAGRIISGKENAVTMKQEENQAGRKNISLLKILKAHYKKFQKRYAEKAEKLDKAIEKYKMLEKRASVLDKLSENKEKVFSDKSMDSKRIENVR